MSSYPAKASMAIGPQPKLTNLVTIEPKDVEWMIPQKVALGKITTFGGDPGIGKSTITLDIAARVTTGSPWPDGSENEHPGSVILLSAEDDPADTIRPRLDRMGADVSQVYIMEGVEVTDERGKKVVKCFSLEAVAMLEEAIKRIGDVRLVVIDPVSAYLSDKDSHNNSEIRGLLAPLAAVAAKYGVAVLLVTHLSKGGGARAMYRVMGSLAFVAAARAAWLVVRDKENPTRRLFLPVKNNLGNDQTGFAFSIIDGAVSWERDPVSTTADEALSALDGENRKGADKMEEACDFLRAVLDGGVEKGVEEVEREAKVIGIAKRTLRRARLELGIRPYKQRLFGGKWVMRLVEDGQKPRHVTVGPLGPLGPLPSKDVQDVQGGQLERVGGSVATFGEGGGE